MAIHIPVPRNRGITTPLLIVLLSALHVAELAADLVYLRNGQVLEGKVKYGRDKITVVMSTGTVTVSEGEIDRIEKQKEPKETVKIDEEWVDDAFAQQQKIEGLIRKLDSPRAADRGSAVAELAKIGKPAVRSLLAALQHGKGATRVAAADALGELRDRSVIPDLIKTLGVPDESLREAAVRALGRLHDASATPALVQVLQSEAAADVRKAALEAIREIGDPLGMPYLVEALKNSALRSSAASEIRRSGDPSLVPFLLWTLGSGSASPRSAASRALSNIATFSTVPALLRSRNHSDAAVRKSATSDLRDVLRSPKTRVLAYFELLKAGDEPEQKAAATALARLTKQRFGSDRAKWAEWQRQQARKEKKLCLVPFGSFDARALTGSVAPALARQFGCKAQVASPLPLPRAAYEADKKRYDAQMLLDNLEEWRAKKPWVASLVGFTDRDLTMPGYESVLSPGRYAGPVLASTFHLRSKEAGAKSGSVAPDKLLRLTRHALAEGLRLGECGDDKCPAGAIFAASDLGTMGTPYCKTCVANAAHSLAADIDIAINELGSAAGHLQAILKSGTAHPELVAEIAILQERALAFPQAIAQWQAYVKQSKKADRNALVQRRIELLREIPAK